MYRRLTTYCLSSVLLVCSACDKRRSTGDADIEPDATDMSTEIDDAFDTPPEGDVIEDVNEEEMCVPADEVCNYIDDDCDGVVDNGFDYSGRVAPGGHPPGAPTDPDVRVNASGSSESWTR